MDLQELKQVAIDAGGLEWKIDPQQYRRIIAADGRPCVGVVGGGHERPYSEIEMMNIAVHLATFNPSAVIRLIERLEAALATVAEVCAKVKEGGAACR